MSALRPCGNTNRRVRRPSAEREPKVSFGPRAPKGCTPALTVIITGIFDDAWLVEIEAIAAA